MSHRVIQTARKVLLYFIVVPVYRERNTFLYSVISLHP
jgi:hypothetical protein